MDKLGDRFDIVAVKNGYGRNFLIPQGIAQIANKINLANLEEIKKVEEAEEVEESLSLVDKESDLIKKALKKHKGKRKFAAQELGISERTLYRKIKELNL